MQKICIIKKQIGILSLFPSPLGIFYNNRTKLISTFNNTNLFPEPDLLIKRNLPNDISSYLTKKLNQDFSNLTFITLSSLSPEDHLRSYMIEGIWGKKSNSLEINNLQNLFNKYSLSEIYAIVPVTYYSNITKSEITGLNLTFKKKILNFSSAYAIIKYTINKNKITKDFSSIK